MRRARSTTCELVHILTKILDSRDFRNWHDPAHVPRGYFCRRAAEATRGISGRVEERRGCLGHAATLRFLSPLIEPDMQISSIRLSDKTSRLRPRLVVAKPAQTYFIVGGEMSRGQIGLSTLV